MGLRILEIAFDRDDETYTSEQLLTGKVFVNSTEPIKVRGIRLTVVGEARVRWTEKRGKNRTTYTGHESYFSSEFWLLGNGSGSDITLPVGQLIYPFNIQLPAQLPSSFEHKHGSVRYTAEVTLDRPWKLDDEIKVPFKVVSPLDLNFQSGASRAFLDEIETTFCCFCMSRGMISATISIPSSGFVPGQTIPVTVRCDNESNIEVTAIEVSLRQKLTFHATTLLSTSTKHATVVLTRTVRGVPFPNKSENFVVIQLGVPPLLPASNLENCGIIDLDYVLKIEIHFSGMHCSSDRYIPILIGTVPLYSTNNIDSFNNITVPLPTAPFLLEPPASASNEAFGISQYGVVPQLPPLGFVTNSSQPSRGNPMESPPPSYEECTHEAGSTSDNGKAESAQIHSAPQYPADRHRPTNEKKS